ncbi:DNA-processing protein DprA [Candidatus Shapirobacteria bacterium]|nr:DNA-processing protein DprA [Candidatus Shapirobacteria bacterium]
MVDWRKWKIQEVSRNDKDFPVELKKIKSCPEKLYFRGEWNNDLFKKTITIVGSRRMTRYGRDIVAKFVPDLVASKITVISGFMYGVDTAAHSECLECGGKTIAVVGGGLDMMNRFYNEALYSAILDKGGLVISEYPSDFKPTVWSFPQRDRIMSALSTAGVLVVEGGIKSGSLITANFAMKQSKKVLAVPGPINSSVSAGPNWLIKSGVAKMVTEVADILGDGLARPEQQGLFKDYSDLSTLEKKIVSVLETEAVTIDELCRNIRTGVTETSTAISMMLMRGLIEEENGKFYLA